MRGRICASAPAVMRNRFELSGRTCRMADDESPCRADSAPAVTIPVSSEASLCHSPLQLPFVVCGPRSWVVTESQVELGELGVPFAGGYATVRRDLFGARAGPVLRTSSSRTPSRMAKSNPQHPLARYRGTEFVGNPRVIGSAVTDVAHEDGRSTPVVEDAVALPDERPETVTERRVYTQLCSHYFVGIQTYGETHIRESDRSRRNHRIGRL